MTTATAAERLGVSQRQVQRLIASGELPAARTAGDAWVVNAAALNALARTRPARGRPWSPAVACASRSWPLGGTLAAEASYNADVYVFAIHTAVEHDAYDLLDLEQWDFHVLPVGVVAALGVKSLGGSSDIR